MDNARKKIVSAADEALAAARPGAESAIDKIAQVTEQALTSVAASMGPALNDARDRISPLVEDAKDEISAAVEEAKGRLAPAASQAVAVGKSRGRRAAVSLGLADEPQQSHTLRNVLVLLGLGGVAAFVYTRLTGKDADPAWTASRDTAAATPQSSTGTSAFPIDESALSSPSEATSTSSEDQSDTAPTAPFASEETVESPVPTTPDDPLERREV